MNKEKIIDNLQALKAAIEAYPEHLIDLCEYRQEIDCGTLYCSIGLAATLPIFKQQDLSMDDRGIVYHEGKLAVFNDGIDNLFGRNSFSNCFSWRNVGKLDWHHPHYGNDEFACIDRSVSDKQLALWRIDKQISAVQATE